MLNRREAEAILTTFIEEVLNRLAKQQVNGTAAAERWKRIQRCAAIRTRKTLARQQRHWVTYRDSIADEATATITDAAAIFKDEALTEFLAGARGKDQRRLVEWIDLVRQLPRYTARLVDLPGLAAQAAQAAPPHAGEQGWARGYRRARVCREALGLTQADRVRTYGDWRQSWAIRAFVRSLPLMAYACCGTMMIKASSCICANAAPRSRTVV